MSELRSQMVKRDITNIRNAVASPNIFGVRIRQHSSDDNAEEWYDNTGEGYWREHLNELDADGDNDCQHQHEGGAVETEVVPRIVMDVTEHRQARCNVQLHSKMRLVHNKFKVKPKVDGGQWRCRSVGQWSVQQVT